MTCMQKAQFTKFSTSAVVKSKKRLRFGMAIANQNSRPTPSIFVLNPLRSWFASKAEATGTAHNVIMGTMGLESRDRVPVWKRFRLCLKATGL